MSLLQRRILLGQEEENMEKGTFVGGGTSAISIPVSSKKTKVAISSVGITADDIANGLASENNTVLQVIATEGLGMLMTYYVKDSATTAPLQIRESGYSNMNHATFTENEITLGYSSRLFSSEVTYEWVAW